MRIALLLRSLNRGGAERQAVLLAERLAKRGHEVFVYLFYRGGAFEDELLDTPVTVRGLDKQGRFDVIGPARRLAEHVERDEPDVLYSYMRGPNVFTQGAAVLHEPLRTLPIVWGIRASGMDLSRYDWTDRALEKLETLFARAPVPGNPPTRVIANSDAGFDHLLRRGYPRELLASVPNGIDVERFQPDAALRKRTRDAWADRHGLDPQVLLVGHVGRPDPKKNHETLLEAWARVSDARRNRGAQLVVVGVPPGEPRENLQQRARRLGVAGEVFWLGRQDDMVAVHNGLDVLVSSSAFGEGFPNVIGEAMACGNPCAVTDVGDSGRIVGETGEVCPPGDPGALADAVLEVMDRVRRQPGETAQACRGRIRSNFTVERMVDETEEALASPSSGPGNDLA